MTTSITSYSSLASPLVVTASGAAAAAKDLATGAASAAKQRLLSALSSADLNGASSKERLEEEAAEGEKAAEAAADAVSP